MYTFTSSHFRQKELHMPCILRHFLHVNHTHHLDTTLSFLNTSLRGVWGPCCPISAHPLWPLTSWLVCFGDNCELYGLSLQHESFPAPCYGRWTMYQKQIFQTLVCSEMLTRITRNYDPLSFFLSPSRSLSLQLTDLELGSARPKPQKLRGTFQELSNITHTGLEDELPLDFMKRPFGRVSFP